MLQALITPILFLLPNEHSESCPLQLDSLRNDRPKIEAAACVSACKQSFESAVSCMLGEAESYMCRRGVAQSKYRLELGADKHDVVVIATLHAPIPEGKTLFFFDRECRFVR